MPADTVQKGETKDKQDSCKLKVALAELSQLGIENVHKEIYFLHL